MKTRTNLLDVTCIAVCLVTSVGVIGSTGEVQVSDPTALSSSLTETKPELIQLSEDGTQFVYADSGTRFIAWGFNYDHDDTGRLIEDYWQHEWSTVRQDFQEMKDLGANLVRVHLQLARFMEAADRPNKEALQQLARLVALAETTGLYLDITGLGCYHKSEVPDWYNATDEVRRWSTQALFWEAIAEICAASNAVFCYDLMNEPIVPGEQEKEAQWLAGEFGGKHFVQRISLDLAGRTREQVADAWVRRLVAAIRKHDKHHMITVGAIPWVNTFPNAKPIFYSKAIGEHFDFVSVHFYPQKGEVNKALVALKAYDIGKPIVIEETSPLWCGEKEFDAFIDASRASVNGYVGFYWGKTIDEYSQRNVDMAGSIMRHWLEYFRTKGPEILARDSGESQSPTPTETGQPYR